MILSRKFVLALPSAVSALPVLKSNNSSHEPPLIFWATEGFGPAGLIPTLIIAENTLSSILSRRTPPTFAKYASNAWISDSSAQPSHSSLILSVIGLYIVFPDSLLNSETSSGVSSFCFLALILFKKSASFVSLFNALRIIQRRTSL